MNETIIEEAARITSSVREREYGHPGLHHAATAKVFAAYLERTGKPLAELDAVDLEVGMMLDKIMRFANQRKRDSLVDIVGYARCAERVLAATDPDFKD